MATMPLVCFHLVEKHTLDRVGDMPLHHEYFDWFHRVARRFINCGGDKLIIMVSSFNSPCLI